MVEDSWNPWKLTAIGMSFLMMIALVTGLVVSNWSGPEPRGQLQRSGPRTGAVSSLPRPVARDPGAPVPAASEASQAEVPPRSAIELCNEYAAAQASHRDKTLEVEKNPASEAVVGTPVGAAGAGAGTLYGLNENRKNDERYREAYRACMRLRGYREAGGGSDRPLQTSPFARGATPVAAAEPPLEADYPRVSPRLTSTKRPPDCW